MAGAACLRPADYCRNDGRAIQRWDCFAGSASATTTQHTSAWTPYSTTSSCALPPLDTPPAVRPDPVLDAADPRSNGSALSHTASGVFPLNHVARQVTAGLLAPWRFAAGVSGNGSVEEVVASGSGLPLPAPLLQEAQEPWAQRESREPRTSLTHRVASPVRRPGRACGGRLRPGAILLGLMPKRA